MILQQQYFSFFKNRYIAQGYSHVEFLTTLTARQPSLLEGYIIKGFSEYKFLDARVLKILFFGF